MILVVAETIDRARYECVSRGLKPGRGLKLASPSTAAQALRGLRCEEGDELIIGYFPPRPSQAESDRRVELWRELSIGGWLSLPEKPREEP